MEKSEFYYALILKFGTMEEAAKALGVRVKPLRRRALGQADMPLPFMLKAIKALGIEDKPDLIQHIFGF